MTRSIRTRITRTAVIGGVVAAAALGSAGAAFAGPPVGAVLQPGATVCTPAAFAGHKVVLKANSTPGATHTVLYRNGIDIGEVNGPGPVTIGYVFYFPGAGTYQGCSTNISSAQTVGQLQLFVDSEVK